MADTNLHELAATLHERGWQAHLNRGKLTATNPDVPALKEDVVCEDGTFKWGWGPEIGPVADLSAVADRIVYVLRTVAAS